MRKIIYMYSSLARQFFLASLGLLLLSRLVLFVEGAVFNMEKFEIFYLPATIGLIVLLMFCCAFLFIGQRFFYGAFSEHEFIFYNLITRNEKHINLDHLVLAEFMSTGIKLYDDLDSKPIFKIPFYRLGIVSPIGVGSFEDLMKYKNIEITKSYTVLPCYSRGFKFISIAYAALTIGISLNAFQIIILNILIFKQFV